MGAQKLSALFLGSVKIDLRPLSYKLEAFRSMNAQTKVFEVQRYIGIVNYYQEICVKCTHTLAPQTKLCSNYVTFKWNDVEKIYFVVSDKIVG